MEIKEALGLLDVNDSSQWTIDGQPRLDVVRELVGDTELTRKKVIEASPLFTRESAKVDKQVDEHLAATEPNPVDAASYDELDHVAQLPEPEISEADVAIARLAQVQATCVAEPAPKTLEERKKEIAARMDELAVKKDVIDREVGQLEREHSAIFQMGAGMRTPAADTQARIEYIKSQNKARAEKAARGRAFIESGLKTADLSPKSALDLAFARRSKRADQRPSR